MQYKKLKNIFKIIFICAAALLFLNRADYSALAVNKHAYAVINDKKIFLEIADTPEKQMNGLMYVKKMPENQGMIFLFDRPEPRIFWMKNMRIPLDIIFVRNREIIKIYKNAPIDTTGRHPLYKSIRRSDSVVEVNAGFCDKYNIKTGDLIYLSDSLMKLRKSQN